MKKYTIACLTAVLLAFSALPAAAEIQLPAAYVALGDSLAAGQTPNSEIDAGYADLIAQELARQQPVAFFSKDLAFPGFTTEDVLERVKSEEAKDLLASANIITLSAGANDLLRLVQADSEQGSLAFPQIQADFALNNARENLDEILAELKKRAPDADVYVMGYYFAYPHARESQKAGTAKQLDLLNVILKQSAEKAGAVFVPVQGAFGNDSVDKVPNAADVHPNFKGYQAMANAFLDSYQKGWKVENRELPKAAPLSFEEITAQQESDRESAISGNPAASRPSEGLEEEYYALREALPYV